MGDRMDTRENVEAVGVSVAEAARLAGIGRTLFLEEMKAGRGPAIARFGRRVIVPVEGLREWLKSRAGKSPEKLAA